MKATTLAMPPMRALEMKSLSTAIVFMYLLMLFHQQVNKWLAIIIPMRCLILMSISTLNWVASYYNINYILANHELQPTYHCQTHKKYLIVIKLGLVYTVVIVIRSL